MSRLWTISHIPDKTILQSISDSMLRFTEQYRVNLADISKARNLFCFSDYSGEEQASQYSVYSFLIIDGDHIAEWDERRRQLRKELLPDGRRISYKNFRDKLSEKFIEQYIKLAADLSGYLITISVSKKIESLFEYNPPLDLSQPVFQKYSAWTSTTLEKAFRVMHLLSLFVAGFSSECQNIIWITDQDNIAANNQRITDLTQLFGSVVSTYN